MLRSVVIGAKQPMFDKALNVKNLHQLEIRLTRGKNLSILIGTEEQVQLKCEHKTGACTAHILIPSKLKQKNPRQTPNHLLHPQIPKPTSYFPALKGEALKYLTSIWHI